MTNILVIVVIVEIFVTLLLYYGCTYSRHFLLGFERRSGQTKDYGISMCSLFAKYAILRKKNKE